MTPLDRAARAVERQFDDTFVELLDPEGPLSSYGLSHAVARAVLAAIREPSEGMVEACAPNWRTPGPAFMDKECAALWQAMIDAALEEG